MLKRLLKTGVLIVVFVVALMVSSYVLNRGTEDAVIDMGAPALPRISFQMEGKKVNTLSGYVDEMDITAMRDTVTPIGKDGTLEMNLELYGRSVSRIRYEVYSLDGSEKYKEAKALLTEESPTVRLELSDALAATSEEAVLRVMLVSENQMINYYTRIERPDQITASECLAFAQDFHTKALEKSASEELESYLEPGENSDNTTYQTVNISSDITHIQWGNLNPEIIGEAEWSLKESNSVYTSILAKYQVACLNDKDEQAEYNIKEFFRVRISGDTIYLLNYNREMDEVFSGNRQVLDNSGIQIGIASPDLQYEESSNGNMIAFVQERDLWLYNKKAGEWYQVFSFAQREGKDARGRNDQHAVRIISMDNSGNLTFAVYGYMNRGRHEGQVGVGIYYFNIGSNAIEEKAFIPSTKSFAIAEDELGKMVYYNHSKKQLFVLAEGTLYQIDLEKDEQTILAENLTEEQYTVSNDGHLMAYQSGDGENTASEVTAMDLKAGESYTTAAGEGEQIYPLGFVNGDFIYGRARKEEAGTTVSGEPVTPMYQVEFRNAENEQKAVYSFADAGIYITDIQIEENLVTLNRVVKNDGFYNVTKQEYIMNNEERKEATVELESYTSARLERQLRLTVKGGIKNTEAAVRKPNQLVSGDPMTITLSGRESKEKFYVYGMGELVAVYDKAGYAVRKAEQVAGVVISSNQTYVWEKGNRDLAYATTASAFTKQGDETSLAACERYMEQYEAKRIDLTGCTLNQVLYVINKGCPMIAMTSSSHAILLTGYNLTDIIYIDPDTGETGKVSQEEMEQLVEGSGNTFIGYIR